MPTIRKATPHDAHALARLAERTFRETFGASNAAEDMDTYVHATYSETIQATEIDHPQMVTLVGEAEGTLIAFAQLRWKEVPSCVTGSAPGEIQRLYVDSAWHGKGIAPSLMQACLDELQACGSDVVWLGVWEKNPRAISFYRKFGFTEAGDHIFPLGRDLQRDLIMVRPVKAGGS